MPQVNIGPASAAASSIVFAQAPGDRASLRSPALSRVGRDLRIFRGLVEAEQAVPAPPLRAVGVGRRAAGQRGERRGGSAPGFYGSNTRLPGQATWWGFWVMVSAMLTLGGGSLLTLRLLHRRDAARLRAAGDFRAHARAGLIADSAHEEN